MCVNPERERERDTCEVYSQVLDTDFRHSIYTQTAEREDQTPKGTSCGHEKSDTSDCLDNGATENATGKDAFSRRCGGNEEKVAVELQGVHEKLKTLGLAVKALHDYLAIANTDIDGVRDRCASECRGLRFDLRQHEVTEKVERRLSFCVCRCVFLFVYICVSTPKGLSVCRIFVV